MSAFTDWNGLKLFIEIAQGGSLAQAARALNVNHSTVFRRLNSLEKEVGGRLFERLSSGYSLTALGDALLPEARQIAESFDRLDRQIVGREVRPKGIVKITAPNNIAYRYLPQHITRFNELYPEIVVEILASNQALNMNTRQADIALRATASPPDHLVGRKLGEIAWGIYAGRSYLAKFGQPLSQDELTQHKLVGATGEIRSLPGYLWLEQHFPMQIKTRCDDMVAMSYFAETGQGLVLLPDDQLRSEITRLFTFAPAGVSHLWILTHPDLRNVTRIKLLMKYLTECFEDFSGR